MRLTASVRLIEGSRHLRRGHLLCDVKSRRCVSIAMEEYVMDSIIRGHHIYKSIWNPVLGEQLTLERETATVMTDTLSA